MARGGGRRGLGGGVLGAWKNVRRSGCVAAERNQIKQNHKYKKIIGKRSFRIKQQPRKKNLESFRGLGLIHYCSFDRAKTGKL